MPGFFTKAQTASIVRPDGKHLSCNSCGLYKNAHSPKMNPYGNFKKGIMCIGETLDETEDLRGKPFQSKSGLFFKSTLEDLGIDLFEDCISLNSINCRPVGKNGKNKKPAPFEIDCCRRIVLNAIHQYKPKLIILLGTDAIKSVIGHRWKKDLGTISKWSGFIIPDQEFKTFICPVFSPNIVFHSNKPEITNTWIKDLTNAVATLDKKFPVFKEPIVHYLNENELPILRKLKIVSIAFDYETTGLKPHGEGHKIVCVSIAVSTDEVYVFMMPTKRSLRLPFIEILENENIQKIGHNIKYEHTWTYNCLNKTVVKNWFFDSLLAAHILDNRQGITGLKFQTYIYFGVVDYSSEISPILEPDNKKDSNAHNKVISYVKTHENAMKLMKYCAWDSIFTFRLARLQLLRLGEMQAKQLFKLPM